MSEISFAERMRLFATNAASAGTAACIAETCTISIDTAKVRLQIQGQNPNAVKVPYTGMANCLRRIAVEEGPTALFKGLIPGLSRQLVFASLRLGLYEPIRNFYYENLEGGDDVTKSSLITKVFAGLTTGALAMCVAQPTDVIKIRLQAQGRLPPGEKPLYSGMMDCARKSVAKDGVIGLWRGLAPNVCRNSVINAAELATYDQFKQVLIGVGFSDTPSTHCMSAFSAGFAATCIGSPFDVVKTRVMQGARDANGKMLYNGMVDCFVKMFKKEGFMSFYNGFIPNYMRIGTWNVIMFLSYEQIKIYLKKES